MAEAVEARRIELGLDPGSFAESADLTREGVRTVRAGHRRKYNDRTIFGVARALKWRSDWYDRLLEGLSPVPEDRAPDLAEEVRLLRGEVRSLADLVRRLDTAVGAPQGDDAAP